MAKGKGEEVKQEEEEAWEKRMEKGKAEPSGSILGRHRGLSRLKNQE
jgi:hypothetical protein